MAVLADREPAGQRELDPQLVETARDRLQVRWTFETPMKKSSTSRSMRSK
jgi:hypothetical protein